MTEDWDEYEDGLTGRKFYFNPSTKEKSWKPPRKSKGSSEGESRLSTAFSPKRIVVLGLPLNLCKLSLYLS